MLVILVSKNIGSNIVTKDVVTDASSGFTGQLSADLLLAEVLFLFAKSFQRVSRQPEHRFFDHIKIHFHAAAHHSTPSVQVCYSLPSARFAGDEINSEVCAFSVAHDRPEMRSRIPFNFLLRTKKTIWIRRCSIVEFYVLVIWKNKPCFP